MAQKFTHHCIICGEGYIFCDSCRNVRSFVPWRTVADTPECYQLYMAIKACQQDDGNENLRMQLRVLAKKVKMQESVKAEVLRLLRRRK